MFKASQVNPVKKANPVLKVSVEQLDYKVLFLIKQSHKSIFQYICTLYAAFLPAFYMFIETLLNFKDPEVKKVTITYIVLS